MKRRRRAKTAAIAAMPLPANAAMPANTIMPMFLHHKAVHAVRIVKIFILLF